MTIESIAAYGVASRTARQHTIAQFQRISMERALSIENELRREVDVLLAVRALFAASESVTPVEFRAFAATATERYPGIAAIGWAPGPSYVVAQIAPDSTAALKIGLDFSSRSQWQSALAAARDSGELTVVEAPESPGRVGELIGVAAIYRNGLSHGTVLERRHAVVGFVGAAMRTNVILQHLADTLWLTVLGLDVRLYGRSGNLETRLLHAHPSRSRGIREVGLHPPSEAPRAFRYRRHFKIGDHFFAVVVTAAPAFFAGYATRGPMSVRVRRLRDRARSRLHGPTRDSSGRRLSGRLRALRARQRAQGIVTDDSPSAP